MAVARMKRVELAGMLRDREQWLRTLQTAEVVEIETVLETESLGHERENRDGVAEKVDGIDRDMADIDRALSFINRMHPIRPNVIQQFAGIRTFLTQAQFLSLSEARSRIPDLVKQADHLNASLADAAQRRAALESECRTLVPWKGLDLTEKELSGTARAAVILGTVRAGQVGQMSQTLADASFGAHAEFISTDISSAYVVLFVSRTAVQDLLSILSPVGFNAVALPPYGQSVEIRLGQITEGLALLDLEQESLMKETAVLAEERVQLQVAYDFLRNERFKLMTANGLPTGEHSFYLKGWVRAKDIDRFEQVVAEINRPYYVLVRDPEEGEEPPSALINRPLVTPFESLIAMFNYPKYGEIDPTLAMAPFFFVAFGFALGDAGYGLLLGVVNLALLKWLPMRETGKRLAWMFVLSSISTMIIGFGTGGFFGDILKLPPLFKLDPVSQPLQLLIVALAFGVIQMFWGVFIAMRLHIEGEGLLAGLASEGAYMVFLAAFLGLLVAKFSGMTKWVTPLVYALAGSTGLVILGSMYGRKGLAILLGVPAGFFKIYNTVGFVSDVLSYSRLMALSLSGAMVGNIINVFVRMAAAKPMYGIGYILAALIFLFGHFINMALNVLGAFVHASRLQYLEFFGKFFEGGGHPFKLFQVNYRFTQVIEEREGN